uniref:Major facilitator superfamily (MFS) profile domain-containing protein n=1 Tax=Scylla olivacea TaxID=85551 RepID=A0A0P4W3K3_SCYOL
MASGEDTVRQRDVANPPPPAAGGTLKEAQQEGKSHVVYQTMAAASIGLGGLVGTVAMGYTSPALPSMRADPDIQITPEQESWVGAVMPLAALAGSLMAGPLVDRFGRRTTMIHLNWPFCLSWALIASSAGVSGVLLGRVLGGICVGLQAVVGSVLMPEMVHVDLRNILAAFPALFGNLGLLVSFGAGQLLSWRGLAWLGASLSLLPVPLLLPLPETPHYLTRTGRVEASLKALLQLRGSKEAAEKEQGEINESVNSRSAQEEVTVKELAHAPNFWPVGVAVGLMVAQQTTGITAVVFFASTILEVGGEALAAKASVLLGVINLLGNVIGIYCIGTCKRRDCLLWSTYGVVTSLLVLATFFWAREAGGAALEVANSLYLVPVVALLTYMVSFALGWGPVPWVFLGEGMPSQVRGKAAALVVSANWGFAFLVTKTFGWSLASLGSANTFLGYAVMTGAAIVLLRPNMPETFKKSTAEMDRLYLEEAAKKHQ